MKIDHAHVMAHMCRMAKEASMSGALIGAGIGGVTLPLIDLMRKRQQRAGKSAFAGALAGGMLGHGVQEISNHGGMANWAQNVDKFQGRTRPEFERLVANNASGLTRNGLDFFGGPTATGIGAGIWRGISAARSPGATAINALGSGLTGYLGGNAAQHTIEGIGNKIFK